MLRDKKTNMPLVWDVVDQKPKIHNDPSVTRVEYEDTAHEVALLGTYEVNGETCRPAFDLLKEHVKKYTPEYVEEVTWVPAATVTRIAKEFGEAAEIGDTVTIETANGPKIFVPYSPTVAAVNEPIPTGPKIQPQATMSVNRAGQARATASRTRPRRRSSPWQASSGRSPLPLILRVEGPI